MTYGSHGRAVARAWVLGGLALGVLAVGGCTDDEEENPDFVEIRGGWVMVTLTVSDVHKDLAYDVDDSELVIVSAEGEYDDARTTFQLKRELDDPLTYTGSDTYIVGAGTYENDEAIRDTELVEDGVAFQGTEDYSIDTGSGTDTGTRTYRMTRQPLLTGPDGIYSFFNATLGFHAITLRTLGRVEVTEPDADFKVFQAYVSGNFELTAQRSWVIAGTSSIRTETWIFDINMSTLIITQAELIVEIDGVVQGAESGLFTVSNFNGF